MDTITSIGNILSDSLSELESHKQDYVMNPERDFTRNRRLSFCDTALTVISFGAHTLQHELQEFFGYAADTPTSSAFIQQRDKIKSCFFEDLFYLFNRGLPQGSAGGKYHYCAVDGSDVLMPLTGGNSENEEYLYYGRTDQNPYYQMHLNAVYDISLKRYLAAYMEPRKGHDEREAFHRMLEKNPFPAHSVFIFDRGYECYHLMAHITREGQFFVIRAKDFSAGGILKGLGLPEGGEFDLPCEKIFTSRCNPDTEHYRRVHNSQNRYFINDTVKEYPLAFRVVRFQLDNGEWECLLTNLPAEEFDTAAMKKIYNMRWGIETSFRLLKYTVDLLDFHSRKISAITAELWARLLMYNFSTAVTDGLEMRKTKSKYSCKINMSNAIKVCRKFLTGYKEDASGEMEKLISRELVPIRPKRKAPRKKTTKRPHKHHYRS